MICKRNSYKPNILVIMADDHGAWALGSEKVPGLETPNFDWLAGTGARFTRAYTPCPVCSPARASFFTGKFPSAHGIHDFIDERKYGGTEWLADQPTLAQSLNAAGYETALFGKWHCGQSNTPQAGFDHWFSHAWGHQHAHYGESQFATKSGIVTHQGRRSARQLTEALEWLHGRNGTSPFFLFYGPADTHTPFDGHPRRFVGKIQLAERDDLNWADDCYIDDQRALEYPRDPVRRRELLVQYLASVAYIDEQVGAIIDALRELGCLDETIILYTSDHGLMVGQHGVIGKGNATVPQNLHEGAIRVPCLLRWPGTAQPGLVTDAFVDHCDWHATLAMAAGADGVSALCPGRNVKPLLTGAVSGLRKYQMGEYGTARMIRSNAEKLVVRYDILGSESQDEFYTLSDDPCERRNRIDDPAFATRIRCLRMEMEAFFERWSDPAKAGPDMSRMRKFNDTEAWTQHGLSLFPVAPDSLTTYPD